MACGVTKTVQGQTVTCDNAGISTHAGLHSGIQSIFWGMASVRVTWAAPDSTTARHRPIVRGEA